MGGHGHHDPYTIPDYKIYKVEDVPKLLKTKQALEAQGLSDPWLRNEVWRHNVEQWGTESSRIRTIFGRGFKYGLGAALITVAISKGYDLAFPSKHDHEHH